MKRIALISFACLSVAFASFDNMETPSKTISELTVKTVLEMPKQNELNGLYDNLKLAKKGLSKEAFGYAVKGYNKLKTENSINNNKYLTIVDFSQSSRQKRFYLIDLERRELIVNTFVAHGKNTGVDKATSFSNTPESNKSSLGFYLTKGTYIGKHGLSLRLAGVEEGFNDNAESRAIVVHGADYVNENRVNSAYMGRSLGCPALPSDISSDVINKIKDGSPLFVYYPDRKYLSQSDVINS